MATLEERRRASGQLMQDSRRANGDRIEEQRRAIGNRMIEERTGKAVVDDINRLAKPERQRKPLRAVQPVGAVPATRGRADYNEPAATSGGGIASPLTETGVREYYPVTLLTSSDGIFTLQVEHVKKLFMTDANSVEHEFNYLDPEA